MNDPDLEPEHTSVELNRTHWNEFFDNNGESVNDGSRLTHPLPALSDVERLELPGVECLRGIHLQCGMGMDTLALASMGADMTGIDISDVAVRRARQLARSYDINASFEVCDVLQDPDIRFGRFDFAYTSHGVLRWLPDINAWARSVSNLLEPGGWLYMFEIHPILYRLDTVQGDRFIMAGDYFAEVPRVKRIETTHMGSAANLQNRTVSHSDWSMGRILQSLIDHDLIVSKINEHGCTSYSRKGMIPHQRDGMWWPDKSPPIPLGFSVLAYRNSVSESMKKVKPACLKR